jgi:hypothetical protein
MAAVNGLADLASCGTSERSRASDAFDEGSSFDKTRAVETRKVVHTYVRSRRRLRPVEYCASLGPNFSPSVDWHC